MAACGVVCLQEFGQYDDWRIPKTMERLRQQVLALRVDRRGLQATSFADAGAAGLPDLLGDAEPASMPGARA